MIMRTANYTLTENDWKFLNSEYPNNEKNSHIGKKALDIAILYFKSLDKSARCEKEINKIDLTVYTGDIIEKYEVKGTSSKEIAFDRLKVSSTKCYNNLIDGLKLLRVCDVGQKDVTFHF